MNFDRFDWYNTGLRTDKRKRKVVQGLFIALVCLRASPTWALTRLAEPWLPSNHPWCGREFGLFEWWRGQTPQCVILDYIFWIYGGYAITAIIRMWI